VSDLPVLRESAGASATFVPPGDADAWTEALASALRGELAPGAPPTRSAADAARELAAVLCDLA